MKLDFSVLDAPVRASDKLEAEWCVPDPRGSIPPDDPFRPPSPSLWHARARSERFSPR